jgi:hypothetical protein
LPQRIDMRKPFQRNDLGRDRHRRKRVDMRNSNGTNAFSACRHFWA